MSKVLEYITLEYYNKEVENIKNRETKVIFENEEVKIKIKKIGKEIFNIIVKQGNKSITDIAKELLVQA